MIWRGLIEDYTLTWEGEELVLRVGKDECFRGTCAGCVGREELWIDGATTLSIEDDRATLRGGINDDLRRDE